MNFVEKYFVDRKNTDSVKIDGMKAVYGRDDLIPMWVADMEFKSPECCIEAMLEKIKSGCFGYSIVPRSYYDAVIDWEYNHHGYKMKKEWIRITPGVVPAIFRIVNAFTNEGDSVIVMTPVYHQFLNSVKSTNRNLVTSDLKYDKGRFEIDFDDFENKIKENNVKLFILCSPHNPCGRVWKREELERVLEICEKYNLLVISDEIHKDLVFGDNKHLPSATIDSKRFNKRLITTFASSKTFNIASLLTSTVVIEDEGLRKIWDDYEASQHIFTSVNIIGLTGVEACLRHGEKWYRDMLDTIYNNYKILKEELSSIDGLYFTELEGTYLVFLDLRNFINPEDVNSVVVNEMKIACNMGDAFGENFKGFVRLNLATTPDTVRDACKKIKAVLK